MARESDRDGERERGRNGGGTGRDNREMEMNAWRGKPVSREERRNNQEATDDGGREM